MSRKDPFEELGHPGARVGEDVGYLVGSVVMDLWPNGFVDRGPTEEEIEHFKRQVEGLKMLHGNPDARQWFDDVERSLREHQTPAPYAAPSGLDRDHDLQPTLETRASTRRALKNAGVRTPGLVFPIVSILSGIVCMIAAVIYYLDGDSLTPVFLLIISVVLILMGWVLLRWEREMTEPPDFDKMEKEWRDKNKRL